MITNILKGIQAYTGSIQLISKLGLWKYFGIPILISIVVATLVLLAAYALADDFGYYFSKLWIWDWGKETFFFLSKVLSGILILLVGITVYKHVVMALSAPFMGPVSEKIEAHILGVNNHEHRKTSFNEQLWRGIRINMRNLGMEILLTIPILIIGFVPILGFVSTILLILTQGYYAGFGNMDYYLERHFNVRGSAAFVRRYKGLAIGNGAQQEILEQIKLVGVNNIIIQPIVEQTEENLDEEDEASEKDRSTYRGT